MSREHAKGAHPTPCPSSPHPLVCSEKDLGERGAPTKEHRKGPEPRDACSHQAMLGCSGGRAAEAKTLGFPTLRDFLRMDGMDPLV